MARLPREWWSACAALWTCIYAHGGIPETWLRCRTLGIPKPDRAGYRYLTIEHTIWRVGLTAINRSLHPWLEEWVPDDLASLRRGTGCEKNYEKFNSAMATAGLHPIAGAKLDLEKCFDNVLAEQTFELLTELGASHQLVTLLREFDLGHERYIEVGGCVCRSAVRPEKSLPQGDPLSPLRLGVLMAAWRHEMRRLHPQISCGVCVDDRVVWAQGRDCVPKLKAALATNASLERDLAMKDNVSKREYFVSNQLQFKRMQTLMGVEPRKHVTLLGIRFATTGWAHPQHDLSDAFETMTYRAARVQMAGGAARTKRAELQQLVLSLATWVGTGVLSQPLIKPADAAGAQPEVRSTQAILHEESSNSRGPLRAPPSVASRR